MSRHFGLAARHRRRRLIAINSASATVPPRTSHSGTRELPEAVVMCLAHIADLLDDTQPRTWVFAGDSLGWNSTEAKRSYAEYFGDVLRVKYQRQHDVVIDMLTADNSIVTFLDHTERRLQKFQPDVLFWMPGLADAARGQAGLRVFADKTRDLANFLKDEGTLLVMATPPLNVAAGNAPYRDLPAYVIVLRELADELGLILIDHWKYWHVARKTKPIQEWTNSEGTRIRHEGHRRMARFLLRTIGIAID